MFTAALTRENMGDHEPGTENVGDHEPETENVDDHVHEAPTRPSFSYSQPGHHNEEKLQFVDEANNINNILRKPSIGINTNYADCVSFS